MKVTEKTITKPEGITNKKWIAELYKEAANRGVADITQELTDLTGYANHIIKKHLKRIEKK